MRDKRWCLNQTASRTAPAALGRGISTARNGSGRANPPQPEPIGGSFQPQPYVDPNRNRAMFIPPLRSKPNPHPPHRALSPPESGLPYRAGFGPVGALSA